MTKKSSRPLFPTFADGYGAPVTGSTPGAVGPTFPAVPVGPLTSGVQPSSSLSITAGVAPPVSGALPAAGSGAPPPPPSPPAGGIVPASVGTTQSYAEKIGERAWALLNGQLWTIETWFTEANALVKELRTETAAGKEADPATHEAKAWLALQPALEHMLAHGDASHTRAWVEEVCLAWWDEMTSQQFTRGLSPDKCYRAMAAYILARHKHGQGDIGGALRWAGLAHVADVLAGHTGSGGAEVVLQFGLGVPQEIVSKLTDLATNSKPTGSKTWKDIEAFPEFVLTRALLEDWGRILVAPTVVPSQSLCRPFLDGAVPWALDAPVPSSDERGRRLELLAAYLASTLPGARPQRGINAPGGACEYDVVVMQHGTNVYNFPGEATSILIECKNWSKPARSAEVGYFLARIMYAGADFGVMISTEGITGWTDKDPRNARQLLEGFCQRERITCVVIKGDHLRALCKEGTFAGLLEDQHRSMRLGKVKKTR